MLDLKVFSNFLSSFDILCVPCSIDLSSSSLNMMENHSYTFNKNFSSYLKLFLFALNPLNCEGLCSILQVACLMCLDMIRSLLAFSSTVGDIVLEIKNNFSKKILSSYFHLYLLGVLYVNYLQCSDLLLPCKQQAASPLKAV